MDYQQYEEQPQQPGNDPNFQPPVMPGTEYQQQPQPPSNNSKVWLWVLLGVIGVIIIVVVVFLIIHFSKPQSTSKKDAKTETSQNKESESDKENEESDEADKVKDSEANLPANCLTSKDLANAGYAELDLYHDGESGLVSIEHMFFLPDSTEYKYTIIADKYLQQVADIYLQNKNKSFTLTISGKVHESTTSEVGRKLANDRANKVKNDLVAKGVPADIINIGEPTNATSGSSDSTSDRNVSIYIKPSDECRAAEKRNR